MTLHPETIGRTTVCLFSLAFQGKEASYKVIGRDSSLPVFYFLSVVFLHLGRSTGSLSLRLRNRESVAIRQV